MFKFREKREKSLIEIVSEEITWFWRVRLGRLGRAYLLLTCTLSLLASIFTIYILLQPLVLYDGFTLSGCVTPLHYDLRVAGYHVRYPFLDSLNTISVFILVFALVTSLLSVLGVIGVYKKWRSWIAFTPASTASSTLLVSLLYSLLRYASLDAIPTLPHTVIVASVGVGRVFLDPPRTNYSWTYYLAWKSLYFFMAFNILLAFTVGSVILLLLKPKIPVIQVESKKLKRKKIVREVVVSEN